MNKINIHFIVPAGAAKGSFSAGFLYQLFTKYKNKFKTFRMDCCSVGALNGLAICSGNVDRLKKVWFDIKSSEDVFTSCNTFKACYNIYYYNGLYNNDKLKEIINTYEINKNNIMNKFNCVVTNIRNGIYQYVNGLDKFILDFVLASASPWILIAPVEIDGIIYTDGGLLQNYPISFVENSLADLIVIVGYDETHFIKYATEGNHVLKYLARLIDITRTNNIVIPKKLSLFIL